MQQLKHCLWIAALLLLTHCTNPDEEFKEASVKENSSDQGNDAYANGRRVNYPSYNTSPLPPNASGMSSTAS